MHLVGVGSAVLLVTLALVWLIGALFATFLTYVQCLPGDNGVACAKDTDYWLRIGQPILALVGGAAMILAAGGMLGGTLRPKTLALLTTGAGAFGVWLALLYST